MDQAHLQDRVSFHYCRWRARLAARSWMKRAQAVSERIATELNLQMEAAV